MNRIRFTLASILICLFAGSALHVQAQDKCGTMSALDAAFAKDPTLKAKFDLQEQQLEQVIAQRKANPAGRADAVFLTVPVVFHIVLANPALVTDEMVQAQLDTLNKDYAGLNGDSVKVPSYFKSVFAHAGIQFCLARRTPAGLPTSGIDRVVTTQTSFAMKGDGVKYASSGGADAWNTSLYLNVWLCPLSGGILGYATFPNTGLSTSQGVVIDYRSVPGGAFAEYNEGKTMTHEIGHYFNLYHIWGDDGGACTGTDYIDDTPNQGNATYGTYTSVKTDNCSPVAPGIMYQNYMDYTDDDAMEMFTNDQAARMQAAAVTYRAALFTSNACTSIPLQHYDASVQAINSPAYRLCSSGFAPVVTIANKGAVTITSLPISARIDNGAAVTDNWTGSLAPFDSVTVTLPGLAADSGVHTLLVYTGKPNGNDDGAPANDSLRSTIMYYDAFAAPLSEGFEGTEYPPAGWDIVNDDNSYTWQKVTGISKTGNSSVVIRNYDDANTGARDYLRLPQISIDNADSAFMTFRLASGAAAASGPSVVMDTLEVLASTDCGATYTSLYKKWGSLLWTTNRDISGEYSPADGEWRKDSVNLTGYISTGKLMLAFRNTNGQGNDIYLDDINIYKEAINPNLKRRGVLITPNPTSGLVNVDFYPNQSNLQGIAIYSSSGQLVARTPVSRGAAVNHYTFHLEPYAAGIYIIKVVFDDRVITQKLLKR